MKWLFRPPPWEHNNAGFLSELLSRLEVVGVGRKCQASVILPVKFLVLKFLNSKISLKVEKTPIKFSHQRNDECGVTTLELRPGWQRTGQTSKAAEQAEARGEEGGGCARGAPSVSFSFSLQPPPARLQPRGSPNSRSWFRLPALLLGSEENAHLLPSCSRTRFSYKSKS